ncbi:hypothetical protein BLS_001224, partial [Venturia inaequalis]
MAFVDTISQPFALARNRSNTSVFIIICVLYTLLQVYLEEEYPGIAHALSNLTVYDFYFLIVANYYFRKALKAAKYGSAYSFLHFAN